MLGTEIIDVATYLGALALACATIAAFAAGWRWRSTAAPEAPAVTVTTELGGHPPAVVELLTNGVDPAEVGAQSTLVDLAARRLLSIEAFGSDRILVRTRARVPVAELTAYEQLVLEHVSTHAIDGVVPAGALTLGPDEHSQRWLQRFRESVVDDARRAGLCRNRWTSSDRIMMLVCVAAAIGPAWLVVRASERTGEIGESVSIGNAMVVLSFVIGIGLIALTGRVSAGRDLVPTAAGAAAAAEWLGVRAWLRDVGRFADLPAASVAVWDRHLAHATALGIAPLVERQLPLGVEDDHHAWSPVGGRWRRVKVRYRSRWPDRGRHPLAVAGVGIVDVLLARILSAVGSAISPGGPALGLMLDAFVILIVVIGITRIVIAVADIAASPISSAGIVLRRRHRGPGDGLPRAVRWLWAPDPETGPTFWQRRRERFYVAVDDGTKSTVLAHRLTPSDYRRVRQGQDVRLVTSRYLRHVRRLEIVAPATVGDGPDTLAADGRPDDDR